MDHRGSFEVQLDRLWLLSSAVLESLPAARWRRLLDEEVRVLLDELSERFAFEEADGYLEPIVSERPELLPCVDQLRAEHARILTHVLSLGEVSDAPVVARDRLRELVREIRRHERSEIALIQEATLTDVGVVD